MEPRDLPSSNPESEDEPLLTIEPLEGDAPQRGIELRPLLNAVSLALAAVLVVLAGAAGIQRLRSQLAPGGAAPIALPAGSAAQARTLRAGQGWKRTGPNWAQQIVFAPSAPRTAYLCGTPSNAGLSTQAPVALGISLDAGHTWQTRPTNIAASLCQVDVDPTDAQDLVLQVEHCITCGSLPSTQLYRSLDGGQRWRLVTLPSLGGSNAFETYQWAWQSSTLVVVSFLAGAQTFGALAVSVAEGPFTWVNEKALLAGIPAQLQLNAIYATSTDVYVDFAGPPDCASGCEIVKRSSDLGNTWSLFQPTYKGQPVQLLDQLVSIGDERTLIGQLATGGSGSATYVSSADSGATWTPLPSPPGNLIVLDLASTPMGVYYAEMWNPGVATATPAIYRLTSGASTWALVGALPKSGLPLVVSWDEQGNALALWSGIVNSLAQAITEGLVTHAP